MAYEIVLTDSTGAATMPESEVALSTANLEGATDITVLSFNVYTDFIALKRVWSHTWAYMTEAEFAVLKGYYDRQFTLFTYPQLTITDDGVELVTVRMSLNPKNVIDNCGTVNDVTVSFRETGGSGSGGFLELGDGLLEL